jgi:hypothetical protein
MLTARRGTSFVSMNPETTAVAMNTSGKQKVSTAWSTGTGCTKAIIPALHKKNARMDPNTLPKLMSGRP